MNNKFILTIAAGLLAFSNLNAQNETSTFNSIDGVTLPANNVSHDGKYIVGSYGGNAFVYNTETKESQFPPFTGEDGTEYMVSLYDVSGTGVAVGCFTDRPAYWKDNAWTVLPIENNQQTGVAFAISEDGSIIAGGLDHSSTNGTGMACYWEQENGEYKYHELPFPAKDDFETEWAYCHVMNILDNNTMYGRLMDSFGGAFALLIKWTRENDGWKYEVIGRDIAFNLDAEHPGKYPQFEEYVTAPEGTQEYEEQVAAYNADNDAFWQKMTTYSKSTIDCSTTGFRISGNGQYLVGTTTFPDPANPAWGSINTPYVIELENGLKSNIYQDITTDIAHANEITDDETILFTKYNPIGVPVIYDSYAWNINDQKTMTLTEYIKTRSGEDYTEQIQALSEPGNSGLPLISGDNNTLISWVGLGAPNINYFVKFAPKNSVADNGADAIAISFANNILTVNRDMPHVTIYDTTGRTVAEGRFAQKDLSHLDNGMYIVSATDGNSSTTLKIMIK